MLEVGQEFGGELYEILGEICPRFADVVEDDKPVMSRWMAGLDEATISQQTGRGPKSVRSAIDKWAGVLSTLPAEIKMRLAMEMLAGAIPSLSATVANKAKIEKMRPEEAVKVLDLIPKLMTTYMKLEKDFMKHKQEVAAMDFGGFGKALGEGK
jgi:hypothetical protein